MGKKKKRKKEKRWLETSAKPKNEIFGAFSRFLSYRSIFQNQDYYKFALSLQFTCPFPHFSLLPRN